MSESKKMSESLDLIDLLTDQPRDVDLLFYQLADITGEASAEALVLGRRVVISLVTHAIAEERHLYPAVRRLLDDGEALADREVAEHDQAEHVMRGLEALRPDDEAFWPTVQDLRDMVRQHVEEEEQELFPRLRTACSDEELRRLGAKVQRTQRHAPTRPHPLVPSESASLALLGPAIGLVDRLRDAATGRGH
jgi:hemerythrin superfamily protein